MKLKLKTREQLFKEGWRSNRNGIYLGEGGKNDRHKYTVCHWLTRSLGTTVDVTQAKFRDNELYLKIGNEQWINWLVIDGQLPDRSLLSNLIERKTFGESEVIYFKTRKKFEFDCSFKVMTHKDICAVKKWADSVVKKAEKSGAK